MDTGIAQHGGEEEKDRDAGAERSTTAAGFGGSFPSWKALCDLKCIRQIVRKERVF